MNKKGFFAFILFLFFSALVIGKSFIYSLEAVESISYNPAEHINLKRNPKIVKTFEDVKIEFIENGTDFIEANLLEMKVMLYKEGKIIKEAEIIAKGNPKTWGESAAGIHKILSGNKASFSNIAKVFMPYALHYFGKYYIHGEPYYPSREKLKSVYSGGCLRLKDKDAEEIYKMSELNMPVLVIDSKKEDFSFKREKIPMGDISADVFLVADIGSGKILAEKNKNKSFSSYSFDRLMTAVIAVEVIDLERILGGYTVLELLYPLFSGQAYPAEHFKSFLGEKRLPKLINDKSESLLIKNIKDSEDAFRLAKYITNTKPLIWKITKGDGVAGVSSNLKDFKSNNLFPDNSSFIGGESSSGEGIFVFGVKDKKIAIILSESENLAEDVGTLLTWVSQSYFKML